MSNSLQLHGLQCAALQPPLSFTITQGLLTFISIASVMQSNHLILRFSFSFCLQSFPASGSFLMSWLFSSVGQSIGASPSATVLLMNVQSLFHLGLTPLISLLSKGLKSLKHCSSKASILLCSAFFMVQLSYSHMTTGKPIALNIWTFVGKDRIYT